MITSQELRIGNWMLNDGCPVKVRYINDYLTVTTKQGNDITARIELVKPIPLTQEILIRAGFNGLPHFTIQRSLIFDLGHGRSISVGSVGTPNEMVFLSEEEEPNVNEVIILRNPITVLRNFDYDGKTHLHQIQNIVFAISGKELDVKL